VEVAIELEGKLVHRDGGSKRPSTTNRSFGVPGHIADIRNGNCRLRSILKAANHVFRDDLLSFVDPSDAAFLNAASNGDTWDPNQ
jgi:hypothetical protein